MHTSRVLSLRGLGILYLVLGAGLAMMLTRHNTNFWSRLPLLGPLQPGAHLSNLALCLMVVPAAGLFPVLTRRYRVCWLVIAGAVVANFVVELWVTVLNTPDLADAWWGTAGVVLAGVSLALIDRRGAKSPGPVKVRGSSRVQN